MRTQLERGFLILLLLGNYADNVPGLLRLGIVGLPALVFGLGIVSLIVTLLLRASAKCALLLAFLALIGFVFTGIQFFVAGSLFGVRPSPIAVELSATLSLAAAFCAIDLWSQWRKPVGATHSPTQSGTGPR